MSKGKPKGPTPHGEHRGYTRYGCRCEACSAAMRAYQVEWRKKNRERIRRRNRAYYLANREARKANSQKRRIAKRDEVLSQRRRHYADNRDHILALVRDYQQANPEARAQTRARRRMAKAHAEAFTVTVRDWARLCARFDFRCAYCREPRPLTQDHVIPIVRGGRHSIGNLLPACGSCNSSKNCKLLVEWRHQRLTNKEDFKETA